MGNRKNEKDIFLLLNVSFIFICEGQDIANDAYIQIDSCKIYLRFSKRSDVESLLGKPEKTQYFSHGGDGFLWDDFTVSFYGEGNLLFHYDQYDNVVRITVSPVYHNNIIIYGKNVKSLERKDLSEKLKTMDQIFTFITDNYFSYFEKTDNNIDICYSFWFRENSENIEWFDMYYTRYW
jgi:hypothetical protein